MTEEDILHRDGEAIGGSEYWDGIYKSGGNSGPGSIGFERAWKWQVIRKFVARLDSVLDIGCGDLSFWNSLYCETYTGVDFSQTVIQINKHSHPDWRFINIKTETRQPIHARLVFCLDLLFHVLDRDNLNSILQNLAFYSEDLIFVYCWSRNPFLLFRQRFDLAKRLFFLGMFRKSLIVFFKGTDTDWIHQKYWQPKEIISVLCRNGFMHIATEKYPGDAFGTMLVFRKYVM